MLESLMVILPAVMAVAAYRIFHLEINFKKNWKWIIGLAVIYIVSANLFVLGGVSDGFEPEFAWGKAGLPFEESDEMLGILETHVFGDLFGYEGRVEQSVLCVVDHA